MSQKKKGYLLVNLGTPEEATRRSVRVFLRPFLMDPQVISLPFLLRWILVNGLIIPLRLGKVVRAYKSIWTSEGSPLRVNTQRLVAGVGSLNDPKNEVSGAEQRPLLQVAASMRYGRPSIESAVKRLKAQGCEELYVLPLFPQYAVATTESVRAEVKKFIPEVFFLKESFYDHELYVASMVQVIQETVDLDAIDVLLFSFHGIPLSHITDVVADCSGMSDCESCNQKTEKNRLCYRGQCVRTAQAVALSLGLSTDKWFISFQSRLGRGAWLGPYTEEVLVSLGQQGKRLALASPSFVNDGLETLEELNVRGRSSFMAAGGKEFYFIPSLNTHPKWVESLGQILQSETGWVEESGLQ